MISLRQNRTTINVNMNCSCNLLWVSCG